jgi:hypothetical protein
VGVEYEVFKDSVRAAAGILAVGMRGEKDEALQIILIISAQIAFRPSHRPRIAPSVRASYILKSSIFGNAEWLGRVPPLAPSGVRINILNNLPSGSFSS